MRAGRAAAGCLALVTVAVAGCSQPEPPPDEKPVGEVSAPALSLRAFDDVCVVRGNVAWTHDLVLPQAFRNPGRRRPRTPLLADWLPGAVRVPEHPEATPLAGTFLHVDNILRGHFARIFDDQLILHHSAVIGDARANGCEAEADPRTFSDRRHRRYRLRRDRLRLNHGSRGL